MYSSFVALPTRTGEVDLNAVKNIKNARAAGISSVDVYMFPCPRCGNPSGQVKTMGKLISNGFFFWQKSRCMTDDVIVFSNPSWATACKHA